MKKQILILAFFVLAMMAGSLSSFGQLTVTSSKLPLPLPATCVTDALHPRPGVAYNYAVLVNNALDLTTPVTGYTWWATQNPNFLDATHLSGDQTNLLTVTPGELIATDLKYNDPTGPLNMNITWSPAILALTKYKAVVADAPKKSTFVAVLANGSCANNLQVFEIDPKPAFTLDIANIDALDAPVAYGVDAPQCVDVVRSASYVAGEVVMDYGTDVLYFEVISSNFVTSWTPTFQIMAGSLSTVLGKEQTADISWYSTLAAAKLGTAPIDPAVMAQVDGAVITATTPLTTTATNTTAGVSVFVRVVIHNNKYESIADKAFILAVDGEDSTGQWDLDNSAASATCVATIPDQTDNSTQTINPRPEIFDNSGPLPVAPSFVPKN